MKNEILNKQYNQPILSQEQYLYLLNRNNYLTTKLTNVKIDKLVVVAKALWISGFRQDELNQFLQILKEFSGIIETFIENDMPLMKKTIIKMMTKKVYLKGTKNYGKYVNWYDYYQRFYRHNIILDLIKVDKYDKNDATNHTSHYSFLLNTKVESHSFRRGSATQLFIQTRDYELVQRFLHHESIAQTQRYIDNYITQLSTTKLLEEFAFLC